MRLDVTEMTRLWSKEFGRRIEADDEFFAEGGTSLIAARVIAAIRDAYGVELPFTTLYEADSPARLVSMLQRNDFVGSPAAPAVDTADADGVPLSVQQQAIWFLEEMAPGTAGYNSTVSVHILGPLDHDTLRAALASVVRRHPALRTRFPVGMDGLPEQQVLAEAVVTLAVVESAGREETLIRDTGRQPFDLETEPGIRWLLIRRDDHDHVLVQVEHHFVHDGWSMWVVLRDLASAYRQLAAGGTPALGADDMSYLDYCRWQRDWLGGPEAARQADHWLREIGDPGEPLHWPYEHRRAPRFGYQGDTHELVLPASMDRDVRGFAQRVGATPFGVLKAAYATLVGSTCRAARPVIGGGLRNRRLPGVQRTVGMFVNTFAMAFPDWESATFAQLARQTTHRLAAAADHQEVPFPVVASRLVTPRDKARNPVFQTSISVSDWPDPVVDLGPGLTARVEYPSNGGAKFDLDVIVLPEPERTRMLWRYSEPLFTRGDIEQLAHDYTLLVDQAIRRADTPLGALAGTKAEV